MASELVQSKVGKSLYLLVTIYSAPSPMGLRASRNDPTCCRYHNPLWLASLHCSSQLLSPDGLAFPERHPQESPLLCILVPLQVGPGSNYPLKYYRCTKWDLSLTVDMAVQHVTCLGKSRAKGSRQVLGAPWITLCDWLSG